MREGEIVEQAGEMFVLFLVRGSCERGSVVPAAVILVLVLLLGRSDAASSDTTLFLPRKDF